MGQQSQHGSADLVDELQAVLTLLLWRSEAAEASLIEVKQNREKVIEASRPIYIWGRTKLF